MPPVGCEGSRLERGFLVIRKEKSPPEELRRARSAESGDHSAYIALIFMAASSGTHAFHTSGWARRNSTAASAPSAWFSSM